MARYLTRYTVTGKGAFPVDMLRYDASYPSDPRAVETVSYHAYARDAAALEEALRLRSARLSHTHTTKTAPVPSGRWASFGWVVSDITTERMD